MKNKFKQLLIALVAMLLLLVPVQTCAAQSLPDNFQQDKLKLDVKSALAIDSKSGQLLYGKNINQPLPIASMTKLVTIYLTLKAIDHKKISWQTQVQPTPQIVEVASNRDFSNVPIKMGHSYTVKQLYQATLIESANGAAMMLAQAVSGSQATFVRQMRQQVKRWGITDAQIYTTCGLPNKSLGADAYPGVSGNAENKMSAKDMAIVGQRLINAYPEVLETTKIARMDFTDQNLKTPMTNFNWMLKGLPQYHANLHVDGLKTGTTDAAGACFIATAKHKGARIITVIMGARHLNGTDPARFEQTRSLLNYVYRNYQPVIFKQNEVIMGKTKINVKNGHARQVNIGMKNVGEIWDPIDGHSLQVALTKNEVEAPVKAGQLVAFYRFKSGSTKLISLQHPEGIRLEAKALHATERVNIFVRIWRWLFGG